MDKLSIYRPVTQENTERSDGFPTLLDLGPVSERAGNQDIRKSGEEGNKEIGWNEKEVEH